MRVRRGNPHLLLFIGLAGGCAAPHELRPTLTDDVERPASGALIFFADGLDARRLDELLARGELPHVQKRFIEGGLRVEHAVASLPPITYPNAVSLLTGVHPGHHGIVGNQWFDRRTLRFQDYSSAATYRAVNEDFRAATLFEILADDFTVSIQSHTRRGAVYTFDRMVESGIDWFFGRYREVDERVGKRFVDLIPLAEGVRRWPRVVLTYFPGIDQTGHVHGSASPAYEEAIRNLDRQIGRIAGVLDALKLSDRIYLVLVTDHGHVATGHGRRFDLARWLTSKHGLRSYTIRDRRRELRIDESYVALLNRLDSYDAALITGAFRSAMIHLRGRRGWSYPVGPEESRRLAEAAPRLVDEPAVEAVLTRDGPARVRLNARGGSAVLEGRHQGGDAFYRVAELCGNPLGFRENPAISALLDDDWHASRTWLAASAASNHPDFVPQAVEMFDSTRTGDVVVFAADDWSFDASDISGHGSCLSADMHIPLYFAGPDVPRGATLPFARLVDVMPTILDFLGELHRLERNGVIDGVSLRAEILRAGEDQAAGVQSPS